VKLLDKITWVDGWPVIGNGSQALINSPLLYSLSDQD
jgi:hypothetical protein